MAPPKHEGQRLPVGAGVGRIGLAIYPGNPSTLYALLYDQHRRPAAYTAQSVLQDIADEAERGLTYADYALTVDPDRYPEMLEGGEG